MYIENIYKILNDGYGGYWDLKKIERFQLSCYQIYSPFDQVNMSKNIK